ncbi:uncharacterized protein B0T23DRAFT_429156 [Neurospora hispaniola]|uniref:Uncharacterized protein n=1 Tax=Neurospora hispaniola TaxID=588809 RepID=A0AAJ0MS62_9PEZI|nr:hypothetical protein B0T23DRAFT_429156 [Neurospora hispaniola]
MAALTPAQRTLLHEYRATVLHINIGKARETPWGKAVVGCLEGHLYKGVWGEAHGGDEVLAVASSTWRAEVVALPLASPAGHVWKPLAATCVSRAAFLKQAKTARGGKGKAREPDSDFKTPKFPADVIKDVVTAQRGGKWSFKGTATFSGGGIKDEQRASWLCGL